SWFASKDLTRWAGLVRCNSATFESGAGWCGQRRLVRPAPAAHGPARPAARAPDRDRPGSSLLSVPALDPAPHGAVKD
ncbi:MAG: hypothetical protein KJ056_08135, partial [Acidimicrobiia bacterium]|nr:hypothetical protein [Acidimicrobiia bacterium]